MNIGIIGTGNFGGPLAELWAGQGHQVRVAASRPDSQSLQALVEQSAHKLIPTTIPELAAESDVVVLAVPWFIVPQVLEQTGDLAGKIVIDVTNSFKQDYTLEHGMTSSAAETIAAKIPQAHVVKAFNTVAAATLHEPVVDGKATSVFIATDDLAAREIVTELVASIGFDPVNAGPLQTARFIEPMVMLWQQLTQHVHPAVAFRVLRPE